MNAQSIRAHSLALLEPRGFRVAASLPLPDGTLRLRPTREIAARLIALDGLFAWVCAPESAVPSARLDAFFETNLLLSAMTQPEIAIIMQERAAAQAAWVETIGWKLENMWPLAHVLGFETPPEIEARMVPDEMTRDLMEFLPGFEANVLDEFVARVVPLAEEKVVALEDLFYCAHNAVRSAQLGGATVPEGFHPVLHGGTVHERRHALTWCLSPGVAWDDTDLST